MRLRVCATHCGPAARLALTALALAASPLRGDDRDLLRQSDREAYVFVLFDASERMNRRPGGEPAPLAGDDPGSRLWQAKAALFEALGESPGVRLGFATFPDQDRLRVTAVTAGASVALVGDSAPATACGGWESPDDVAEDLFRGYTFKWPAAAGPLAPSDVIPLSWRDPHHARVRERLAPNLALGEATPDFGIARYFSPVAATGFHPLRDERARPVVGRGAAGLAAALESFGRWFREWRRAARREDPAFACRRVTLLVITGGGDECAASAEAVAESLRAELGVTTRVAALGSDDPALDRLAAAGGGRGAGRAADRRELASLLRRALAEAGPGGAAFAGRPVVSAVAAGAGALFRSGFTPLTGSSRWPGRLEALRPPLGPAGSSRCAGATDAGCRLWEAGEVLLGQAPSAAEAARGDYRLGGGVDQRRVFWAAPGAGASERRLLLPPADDRDRLALYGPEGMGLDPAAPDFAAAGEEVLRQTLVRKPRPGGGGEFVLGDVFHSEAVLIGPPDRTAYYAGDLEGRLAPCGPRLDGRDEEHLPYPCFVERHRLRRRMLAVGANDGQVHVFDAGRAVAGADGEAAFGPGSGRELFAFVPRAVLPALRRMAQGGGHEYTVDGTMTVDDVVLTDRSTADGAREWRTVLLGGLRRGGAAYYALDVTQPDRLDGDRPPRAPDGVPSCLDGGPACAPEAPLPGLAAFSGRPFPDLLWEFTDRSDEDGNGAPDLGETWSRPGTGRVRTTAGDRFVAIFGGGLGPVPPGAEGAGGGAARPRRGNFLYMLDIDRGEILYKRRLDRDGTAASVPSEPAAVDLDGDGYLDRVYVGTTAGILFRVDLSAPGRLGEAPGGGPRGRVGPPDWDPVPLFDTGGRPLFFPPAVIHVAGREHPALAFGTGDRSDLFSGSGQDGRLYVMLDEGAREDGAAPLTEEALVPRAVGGADLGRRLLTGDLPAAERAAGRAPGWFLRLERGETLLSRPRAVAGLVLAPTFVPRPSLSECTAAGVTRTYLVQAENGDSVRDGDRYLELPGLAPAPVLDLSSVADPQSADGSEGAATRHPCRDEDLRELTEGLRRELFGPRCEFPGVSVDLTLVAPDGDLACLAPVPVCAVRGNWGPPPADRPAPPR